MANTPFAFTPVQGLRDSTAYPTNPGSEAAARDQVQKGLDQVRDYINSNLVNQESWISPTLQNSWTNFSGGYDTAGYYKDQFGIVRLKGQITGGALNTVMLTLPEGYRPLLAHTFVVSANGAYGQIDVLLNGTINLNVGSTSRVSLSGISFRADQ